MEVMRKDDLKKICPGRPATRLVGRNLESKNMGVGGEGLKRRG